jgi:tetratricopeptide (TPR) repeat protein
MHNLLLLGGMKTVEDVKLLAKYPKYVTLEGEKNHVVDLFKVFTNEVLIQNSDTSSYIGGFDYLTSHLKDTFLIREISHVFCTEMARFHYQNGNTPGARAYIEKAFILDPDNHETQSALIDIIFWQMNSKPVGDVFPTALTYYNKYEQLRNNNAFVSMLASVALTGASQSFSLNRSKEALEYLNEFEKIFRPDLEVNSFLISDSFTSAAVYYFGKGRKTTARSYIDKGLKYSPGNYKLLQLKNSF